MNFFHIRRFFRELLPEIHVRFATCFDVCFELVIDILIPNLADDIENT